MRVKRKRAAEQLEPDQRTGRNRRRNPSNGIPKLGLWECGIGSGWK